jgi:threonine/homoserine/homoserine lactone efflux protein
MSLELFAAYLLACIVITLVPGPTVTLIVANSLTHGTRAGLLNVAGTQLGLAVFVGVLMVGLASVIETMGMWFDWLRLAGAAYLVWIGIKMLRVSGRLGRLEATAPPRGGFFLQGFLVMLGNPKVLIFFGAFIPQFVDPAGNYVAQVILLGGTAMATAAVTDAGYAILTGRARLLLTRARTRLISRIGGLFLIGGGVWLALARTR